MTDTVLGPQQGNSSKEMDGLCPQLLLLPLPLPDRGVPGSVQSPSYSETLTPLPTNSNCLLVEATATEDSAGSMEIFVEAVTGDLSQSAPGETPGVLVKVVKLYFCEGCEQSFPEPALLALHHCPKTLLQSKGSLSSSQQSAELNPGDSSLPNPLQGHNPLNENPLPCPVCGQEFAQPQALKSHFKSHQVPPEAFSCFEPGCEFLTRERKELQNHLQQAHSLVPVPCSFRACPLLFGSQHGMELHRRSHYPFQCSYCNYMGSNVKLFCQHQRNHLPGAHREPAPSQGPSSQAMQPATERSSEEGRLPKGTSSFLPSSKPGEEEEKKEEHGSDLLSPEGKEEEKKQGKAESEDQGGSSKKVQKTRKGARQFKGDVAAGSESLFKTHMCPECKRCFKKRTHLVEHLHLHFPDPSLQCPNCQKFFTSKSKLKIHLLRELGEKAHRCPLCHYRAVEKNALNRHMASMHEDISNFYSDVYACPVCREEFRLSQALKEHLKSHAAEPTRLHCFQEGCSHAAPDRKAFIRHLKEAHGVRAVECRHHACPMLFATAEAMEAHRKSHYAFHCPHCDFACSNKHLFRKHKKQGHPGSEELRCAFCPFATFNPVAYQDHVGKMHAHEKIHQCPECNFATAHKRVLIRHTLLHTGEKPHKCELCDFTCRDVSYLSKHMLTHSNTKDYMCTECGYVTKWKHYLSVHMRKHAGDLRYQCNQCSYRCHRADQLSSHKLRHQGKSLMCEVCAFACKRKYELQKHMASQHRPGAPAPLYPCRYCSYQSRHKQALLSHENCKHTRLREFRCALCDYRTFSNTTLFFHKRKAHGYVPGDQAWPHRCAGQEQEAAEQGPAALPAPEAPSQPSPREEAQCPQPATSVKPSLGRALSPICVEKGEGKEGEPSAPHGDNFVGQSPSPAEVDEEGCTLHLEALSVELEPAAAPAPSEITETPHMEYGDLGTSEALGSEEPDGPLEGLPDFEEEPDLQNGGHSGLGAGGAPLLEMPAPDSLRNPSSSDDPSENFKEPFEPLVSPGVPAPSQIPQSESVLKALRKRDKEQAETLVLEGRVQMLVVQGEGQAFRCPHCPFVTRREKALGLHAKMGCQGRREPLLCSECGASFKQQRGLNTHLLKKCPVLLKKKKPALQPSSPALADPRPAIPVALESVTEELAGPAAWAVASAEPPVSPPSDSPAPAQECLTAQGSPEKFHFEQGKFHCRACPFLCSRLSSITSHVTEGCRSQSWGSKRTVCQTEPSPSSEERSTPESEQGGPGLAREDCAQDPQKGPRFSCPTCPFSCRQERALRTHQARGCPCTDPTELRCSLCPFTARAPAALRLHQKRRHRSVPVPAPARGPRPLLQCQDCSFTCKQSRCLQQHRRLKHEGVKPHQCPFCEFSTTRRYRLEAHQSRHTGVGRIPCGSCPQTFGTNSKLRLHRLRVHDKTPTHFCPLCDYSGYLQHDITRHINSCHQGTPAFACPQCEAHFSSETALKQHALRRHPEPAPLAPGSPAQAPEGPLHCPHCGLSCPSPASLRCHTRKQHPRLECSACQEAFSSRGALEEHRRQQHFSHRCHLCSFAARERAGLVRHYLEQHEGGGAAGDGAAEGPPLRCPFCDFGCRHQLVLDHHVKGHGGTRLYKCTDCAYSTKNRQKITWHSRIHTGEKPYRCHLCPYACADPSRLKYHMRIHKEERKYLCPECGYKCKWVNQLKYHMTKHTGLKPYQCPECEYCTNRADALRVHQETRHQEARAFMCEQCGKAFKTRFLLRTHLRKHSEDKPYVCNVCHRAFRWAAGLRHHALTHTDRHPFFCRLCSYKAKQKFQVVKHVRRHHPDQTDPSQSVGKDPTTPTVHLHDVQLEDPVPLAPAAPEG
ncbi:zinc finger protein 142 isoform X2 [Antechinus flavipes]|uniref:zinc finger protein 142 isoform X2 n=1 Tax=Antechinus flavipes TaxID=38775 RepID=UPI002235A946|nr:zinc finger protein 142 isoform X2 [Antechinus flavipes]